MAVLKAAEAVIPERSSFRKEPLAEGLVPLKKNGQRDWESLTNARLVELTETFIRENNISRRKGLEEADSGLYQALCKRKLLDRIEFEEKRRHWKVFDDGEVIEFSQKFMEGRGIDGKTELRKADYGLYQILKKRKLLDRVRFCVKVREWGSLSDSTIIDSAQKLMQEKGINGSRELKKTDNGLYYALWKRRLLDRIEFRNDERRWSKYSDEQLIDIAKGVLQDEGIDGRAELEKADSGLYQALRGRMLLDKIGISNSNSKDRKWTSLSDKELIVFAKRFVEENGIVGRKDLERADNGLIQVLRRRKLLDKLEFEGDERAWSRHSDEELVSYSQKFASKNQVKNKHGLQKADQGLYAALWRRKLLDKVFSVDVHNPNALSEIIDSVREFGGKE